jgi:hypothetical protein
MALGSVSDVFQMHEIDHLPIWLLKEFPGMMLFANICIIVQRVKKSHLGHKAVTGFPPPNFSHWGVNSGHTPRATPPAPFFVMVFWR